MDNCTSLRTPAQKPEDEIVRLRAELERVKEVAIRQAVDHFDRYVELRRRTFDAEEVLRSVGRICRINPPTAGELILARVDGYEARWKGWMQCPRSR